jgi:hypothetical protein
MFRPVTCVASAVRAAPGKKLSQDYDVEPWSREVQEDELDAVSRVLSVLRAAHNMLSVDQIADQTGIDTQAVEAHLITLQLRGFAQCAGEPFERDRRRKPETWKAAPPDPA